jgi:hypothetical protein
MEGATIGILGCGNIGEYLLRRLLKDGCKIVVLEASPAKRAKLAEIGIVAFPAEEKEQFLTKPFVAVCCNANGGTLDDKTIQQLCANQALRFICGCENLVMPDPSGVEVLRKASKIYTPMEYCGMMGYLTAVEEYLSKQIEKPFSVDSMVIPAQKLEEATVAGARRVIDSKHAITFEMALREEYVA